jgi:hypothetical protein
MTERPLDVTAVAVVADDVPLAADRFERLAAQTLGAGRFEVIAVTSGADGARDELDRFAEKHPEVFRAVRSEHSGTAALGAALERAQGRYVCLLGPGDALEPDALERLVRAADEAGADVVVCGDAAAETAAFRTEAHARGLAAARLFNRALIEAEDLRLPEGDELGAIERFALRVMANAEKIIIVAEASAFPAAPRPEAAPPEWVAAAERLAATADEVLEPGEGREAVLHRAFTHEIAAALDPRALKLDAFARAEHWRAVADFADARLTEAIRRRLPTELRVRVSLAQHRDRELLEAALAQDAPPLLLEDGRLYVRYPGFRESGADLPDAWFEATDTAGAAERVTDRLARGVAPRYLVWTGVKRADYRIEYSFALPVEGIDAGAVQVGAVRVDDGGQVAPRGAHVAAPAVEIGAETEIRAEDGTTVVTARLLVPDFTGRPVGRWSLRAAVTIGAVAYDLPLKAPAGYVRKEGMLRGVTVEWGPTRSLVVRVRERATFRGVSRLKGLLSDKLRSGFTSLVRAKPRAESRAGRQIESDTDTSFGVQSSFIPNCLALASTTDIQKGSRGYLCSRPGEDRVAAGGPVRREGAPSHRRGRERAHRGRRERRRRAVPRRVPARPAPEGERRIGEPQGHRRHHRRGRRL